MDGAFAVIARNLVIYVYYGCISHIHVCQYHVDLWFTALLSFKHIDY